jgi:hypothetical protein
VRLLQSLARGALVLRASLRRPEREQRPRMLEGKRKTLVLLAAPRERVEGAGEVALRNKERSQAAVGRSDRMRTRDRKRPLAVPPEEGVRGLQRADLDLRLDPVGMEAPLARLYETDRLGDLVCPREVPLDGLGVAK